MNISDLSNEVSFGLVSMVIFAYKDPINAHFFKQT